MKTSRRLLFGTFAALLATPVVLVAYGRISGAGTMSELPAPERATAAELAALRDFERIDVRGDFTLDIARGPDYSVSYTPISGNRGFLRANVDDGVLRIEGYGNRADGVGGGEEEEIIEGANTGVANAATESTNAESTAAHVRITLPDVTRIEAQALSRMTLRGFDRDTLALRAVRVRQLVVEDNRIGSLDLTLEGRSTVDFRNNDIGTSRLSQFGTTITMD